MLTAVRDRLTRFDRRERLPLAIVVAVFTLGLCLFGTSTVTQDGMVYYAQSRSAVFDRDFDLGDEYLQDWAAFSAGRSPFILQSLPRDDAGRFVQVANPGTVVMLAPGILSGLVGVSMLRTLGVDVSNTGFGIVQFGWTALWAAGLVLASLIILYRYLMVRIGAWPAAGAVVFGLFGGTMALWTLVFPMHAHELALPVTTAIVVLSLARLRHGGPGTYLVLGLLLGFVVSVRPVAGLYGVVPAAWLAIRFAGPFVEGLRSHPTRLPSGRSILTPIRDGLVLLAGFLSGHLPALLLANDAGLFGSSYYEETGYLTRYLFGNIPQGLVDLVFDRAQGQVWWVPASVIALIGIVPAFRRDRFVGLSLLGWTVAIYVFVASLGGQTMFGSPNRESRHLADLTPVMIVALGYLLSWPGRSWLRAATAAVIGSLAGYALLLKMAQIEQFRPPGPATAIQTLLDPSFLVERVEGLWRTMILGPIATGARSFDLGTASLGLAMAALLSVLVAIVTPVAWRVGGRLSAAERKRPGEPSDAPTPARTQRPLWRPVWVAAGGLLAAATVVGLAGPVGQLLFPPDARLASGSALATHVVGGSELTIEGPLHHVAIGSSPSGGSSVDRPLPAPLPAPAVVRPSTAESVDVTPDGVSFTVTAPPVGRLIAVAVPLLARSPSDVTVEAQSASGVVLASTLVPAGEEAAWAALPLAAGPVGAGEDLVIRLVSSGPGPRLAAAADGGPAASLYFAEPAQWPGLDVDVDGATLTLLEPGLVAPPPARLVLRPTGRVLRLGPYPADLLLASSSSHEGWRLTLPRSAAAGGWRAAAQPTGDAPLVLQLRAPAPIDSIRLTTITTSQRREEAMLRVGSAAPGATAEELVAVPIAAKAATSSEVDLDGGGRRDLDIHVALDSSGDRTAINVVWIDLTLATGDAAAGLWSADDATFRPIRDAASSQLPVEVAAITDPSPIQRLGSELSLLSARVRDAWPLAIVAGIVAVVAAWRSAGRALLPGAWLAAAGMLLILGIIGMPREILVPNSPPFASGSGSGVTVGSRRVGPIDPPASDAEMEYIAPPLALPPGARDVALGWSVAGPKPAVAVASSSDGRHPVGWRDVSSTVGPLPVVLPATDRYLHVRFRFAADSGDLMRLTARYRP